MGHSWKNKGRENTDKERYVLDLEREISGEMIKYEGISLAG